MATSTLNFYGDKLVVKQDSQVDIDFPLVLGKNYKIDDLEFLLQDYLLKSFEDFMYIRHALNIKIRVDFPQSYLNDRGEYISSGLVEYYKYYRYVQITNSDEDFGCYYFITAYKQISQSCVEFTLFMDTLNTCLDENSKRALKFTNKTIIKRRHENRFVKNEDGELVRRLNVFNESINPLLLKDKSKDTHLYTGDDSYLTNPLTWYLIYIANYTDSAERPLSALLLPSEETYIKSNSTEDKYSLTGQELASKTGHLLYTVIPVSNHKNSAGYYGGNPNCYIVLDNTEVVNIGSDGGFVIWVDVNNTIHVKLYPNSTDNYIFETTTSTIEIHNLNTIYLGLGAWQFAGDTFDFDTFFEKSDENIKKYPPEVYNIVDSAYYLSSIKSLDRTDPSILKIIGLPYPPFNFTLEGLNRLINITTKNIVFNAYFGALEIDVNKVNLIQNISFNNESLSPFEGMVIETKPSVWRKRYIEDSKLWYSEFYYKKYVYDSFSYIYNLENYFNDKSLQNGLPTHSDIVSFKCNYLVSNGLNSSFLFDFFADRNYLIHPIVNQDYDEILYVNRNNQIAIFNSDYLNYVRSGYNYDIKSKNLSFATDITTSALSFAGSTALSSGFGSLAPFSMAAGALNFGKNIVSAISNNAQKDIAIQKNLSQLKMQGMSVQDADDFNLLKYYSKNKLKVETWSVNAEMRTLLNDMFYYIGYTTNVMEVPTHNNRIHFDYLECTPNWESTRNFDNDIIEDIDNRLNEGVTFFHLFEDEYDLNFIYENWEADLL